MNYVLGPRAAAKLKNLFRGADKASGVDRAPYAVADGEDYPPPFTFAWSATEDAWIVWLPGGSIDAAHDYQGALEDDAQIEACDEYGAGWWKTELSATTGSWTPVYLDCQYIKSSDTDPGTVHAYLTTSPGAAPSGLKERHTVRVAEIYQSSDGAKNARPIVDGAVILSGGSASPGVTGDPVVAVQIEYDDETHKLTAVPRTLHFVNGLFKGYEDGDAVEVFEAVPHVAHD